MGFVVIRHPEIGVGTCPADTLDLWRAQGWVRVSDERTEPSLFHLPDFADAPELDAEAPPTPSPEQEPEAAPAQTTKKEKS